MTSEELFKIRLNQTWLNAESLLKKLLVAIPVGIAVSVVLWAVMKLIELKCPNDSRVVRILKTRKGWILGFVFYISLLIQVVIISREFGSTRVVDFVPFYIPGGDNLVVLYSLANAAIFIPFGILVPKVFHGVNTAWKMILFTLITSVCIETIQYILACGYTEVEDVIMNVIGGIMGYLIIKRSTLKG